MSDGRVRISERTAASRAAQRPFRSIMAVIKFHKVRSRGPYLTSSYVAMEYIALLYIVAMDPLTLIKPSMSVHWTRRHNCRVTNPQSTTVIVSRGVLACRLLYASATVYTPARTAAAAAVAVVELWASNQNQIYWTTECLQLAKTYCTQIIKATGVTCIHCSRPACNQIRKVPSEKKRNVPSHYKVR